MGFGDRSSYYLLSNIFTIDENSGNVVEFIHRFSELYHSIQYVVKLLKLQYKYYYILRLKDYNKNQEAYESSEGSKFSFH